MTLKRIRAWWRSLWLPNAIILEEGPMRISWISHILLHIENVFYRRMHKIIRWDARRTERRLRRKGR